MEKIHVNQVISESKFNRFHFWLLFWCCVIIMFDSYDLVIYGSVLPVLMEEWALSPVEGGAIGSYGFFGMMIGAILFGILADKFGRKNVLIASTILYSITTALCGFAPGPITFSIFRFLGGLGIGGVMPNAIALLTDYAPKNKRNMMIAIAMCCFPIGGILASLLSIVLIPSVGWEVVYYIAALPLLLLPFMIKHIHDSPAILLAKGRMNDLRLALSKINNQLVLTNKTEFEMNKEEKNSNSPVVSLFKDNRALGTFMIWIAFFMCLLMINGLTTWLPNFMVEAGYALGSSLTFMIVLNVGSIIGTLFLGGLADKWGTKRVLIPMFIVAAISLSFLGFGKNMLALYVLVGITGACTIGAQSISYAFASQYYPSFMRATAVGLASGIGRVGAVVGPTFGGFLLMLGLPVHMNFIAFAIPGIIAAIAFSFVPLTKKSSQESERINDESLVEEAVK
ncbi:MFS transporter [Virgibacillus sediminis]|uniref:MFS transporter n=1 Tax=Virgibacillus sediminis TaxID=202260 RepID=A0ABV7A3F7_9BACI